ncbi:hypothetical protein FB567DRAFT_575963 [Paraphoma chrysanthemicola]|uniref:Uncharacterized protein n=1 Tax=Paraphoma chrysanthemicola TaxID=798071 RepID=A0A8K0RHS9_9PLEO|nr:hypothetical protein FB567DRAFT_575963 [Paraphoma chrysanthemicola]
MDPNPTYPVLPDWPLKQDVFTGFWINRSLGRFQAATITLDQRMWNMFIAFIALFIGATARSIWKLISHVWRHRLTGRFGGRLRALSLFGVAVAVSSLTTAASFFSSDLFNSTPSEVLIAGRHCGTLPFGYPDNEVAQGGRVTGYNSQKSWEDYSYATQCYHNKTNAGCDKFAYPSLPYTSDRNARCPFAPEICKLAYDNLVLDTGEVDSVKHPGLNRGPRFTLRYRTHCGPLVTKGFVFSVPLPNTTQNFLDYRYGKDRDGAWSIFWIERDDKRFKLPGRTYRTASAASDDGPYFADQPVGVLGCSTQRFICNPDAPEADCINSMSRNKSVLAIQKAWPNLQDQQKMFPILAATYQFGIGKGQPDAMYELSGAPVLLARNTMTNNRQTARLPSNQWQLEREHIFTASLAAWQSSIVAYARGSWYGHPSCDADFPCERICHSQRVRTTDFHSVSAWTLFILLISGGVFMLMVLYLEEIFDMTLEYTSLGKNARLRRGHAEWKAGSTLQLQRIAHENLGFGTWKRTDEAVPVTDRGDTLGTFNIDDEKHALLVNLSMERRSHMRDVSVGSGGNLGQENGIEAEGIITEFSVAKTLLRGFPSYPGSYTKILWGKADGMT